MLTTQMLIAVDEEIARLQLVRSLLSDTGSGAGVASSGGNAKQGKVRVKRVMSAEARERIASAQRKRWAASKKATKKTTKP